MPPYARLSPFRMRRATCARPDTERVWQYDERPPSRCLTLAFTSALPTRAGGRTRPATERRVRQASLRNDQHACGHPLSTPRHTRTVAATTQIYNVSAVFRINCRCHDASATRQAILSKTCEVDYILIWPTACHPSGRRCAAGDSVAPHAELACEDVGALRPLTATAPRRRRSLSARLTANPNREPRTLPVRVRGEGRSPPPREHSSRRV